MNEQKVTPKNIIQAMGLVFGDIGTSPIYTLTVIFLTVSVTTENVIGVLSLIFWSLLLIITTQYTWLAMSLSKRGEGGTIVLNEILRKLLKSTRSAMFFSFLTYLAVSLLIGECVVTPSISILSTIEGLRVINIYEHLPQLVIVVLTLLIILWLFNIQKRGTEQVSKIFGPIMVTWFSTLAIFGLISIYQTTDVLQAINPINGLMFLKHQGFASFFILSQVLLCITGAEALYADMGHLGRKPIVRAWYFVFFALVVNYMGQGAYLLRHPECTNVLFSMIKSIFPVFYIPFLFLCILAAITASQAMISGTFAIIYQAINTRILPMFKVDYTSEKINSQIYIGTANAFLLLFVILTILVFPSSSKLANAYGFALVTTFNITITLMATIFFLRKKYFHLLVTLCLGVIDFTYFLSALTKIPQGAYWALFIATIPFCLIMLYVNGQKAMFKAITLMDKEEFLTKYNEIYPVLTKLDGTALFFARGVDRVPPYIVQTLFVNNILYKDNIFVQINKANEPFGLHYDLTQVALGLRILKIEVGYMDVLKLEKVLKALDIDAKGIFYGVEEIETNNFFWHIFALIKKITPSFVSFYKLPYHKLHGVITQVKM
ncbi:KUP/HAK/KT family potassium transporter [bacterium]|nr:KUP/HAK/KT family potassium transporter [bacterium]